MALIIETGITIGSGITIAPEAAPPDITASIDFAYDDSYNSGSFGYVRPEPPSQAGFGTIASQTPVGIIDTITYSPTYASTTITFKTGTYTGGNGTLVVTTPWRINGQDGNYSVTIAAVTQTMSQGPDGYIGLLIAGDPFNLQSQFLIGNVAVEIDLPAPAITSYSSPGDYSTGGVIITQIGGNKLIVQQGNWSTSTATILALPSSTVIDVVYFGSTSYELTLTSGFDYNAGQDWFEATFTSLTPTPEYPIDGYGTTISFPQPPILGAIAYNGSVTQFALSGGTYGAVTVVAGTSINGSSTFTATVDGISQLVTMSIMGTVVAGDPWDLENKVGQTLTVEVALA